MNSFAAEVDICLNFLSKQFKFPGFFNQISFLWMNVFPHFIKSQTHIFTWLCMFPFLCQVQPKHVKEAFRLLNKSIIRVETPDVQFDEDEEEQQEGSLDGAKTYFRIWWKVSEKIDLLLYFGGYNLAHQHILCSTVCRPCPLGVGVGWGGMGWRRHSLFRPQT